MTKINLSDFHRFIDSFTHIIYRKKCHTDTCEGFHLHACLPGHFYCTITVNCTFLWFHLEIHTAFCDWKNMAHRNQFGSSLCTHNSGSCCHSEHVPLSDCSGFNRIVDFLAHQDTSFCRSLPDCVIFLRNIDHDCFSIFIKMC